MVDWKGIVRLSEIGRDVPAGRVTLATELMAKPPVLITIWALGMATLLVNTTVVFCDTGRLKLSGICVSTAMVVFMLAWSIFAKSPYRPPSTLLPILFKEFKVVFRVLI